MLLAVEPVSLISLFIRIVENTESILFVFHPLSIVDGSTCVVVRSPSVLSSLLELSLEPVSVTIAVEAFTVEFIFPPNSHIDITVGEAIHSLALLALPKLPDVL